MGPAAKVVWAEDVTKVNVSGRERVILYLAKPGESRPRVGGASQVTISRDPDRARRHSPRRAAPPARSLRRTLPAGDMRVGPLTNAFSCRVLVEIQNIFHFS